MRDRRARRVPVAAEEPLIGGDRPDHADAFEIRLHEPEARSAEEFVRSFEHVPRPVLSTIWIVHRYLLRDRLGPPSSPAYVLGWKILTSEPDVVHLEGISPVLGRGVLIGRKVDPSCVVITTYFFYTRPALARATWMIVGPLHRAIAPYLLDRAAATSADGAVKN